MLTTTLHIMPHLLEAWKDILLLQAVDILLPEEGSLQLGRDSHQPGEGSLLLLEGNHPLREGNHQPGVGIHQPVGGSLLVRVGSHLLLEDNHQLGVDMPLAEVGILLPGVGIHRIVEGILGSSSSEPGNDMKLWPVTVI